MLQHIKYMHGHVKTFFDSMIDTCTSVLSNNKFD